MARQFQRLSNDAQVNMTGYWHHIANLEHFWIKRRFEVLRNIFSNINNLPQPVADIGCGQGLLQRQLELSLGIKVDGFDLDEISLSRNISQNSDLYLYNINDCLPDLYQAYSSIFLFDIIEHIQDQSLFLKSVLHHLKPGGLLFINVPAFMHLYSAYDKMAGHIRRYNLDNVVSAGNKQGLSLMHATYWGAPYYIILLLRKAILTAFKSEKQVIECGFKTNKIFNMWLLSLGKLEILPQCLFGTSIMVVFRKC